MCPVVIVNSIPICTAADISKIACDASYLHLFYCPAGPFRNSDIDALECAKVRGLDVISIAPIQRTMFFAGGLHPGFSGGVVVDAVTIHLESENPTKSASRIFSSSKSDSVASVDASLVSHSMCHASTSNCVIIAFHDDIQSFKNM